MADEKSVNDDNVVNSQSITELLFGSPLNTILTVVIAFLVYKLIRGRTKRNNEETEEEVFKFPDPLPKHDMTLDELKNYDGKGADKRICIAILGKVYDCTKGYRFYGPGGPYAPLAGHDATRALAQFDVEVVKEEWDDVSDLTPYQMSSVSEWMEQFSERYDYIGRLVKDVSEKNDSIGDEEEEGSESEVKEDAKDEASLSDNTANEQ
jgi:membrane-associated progesterone receptor component